MRFTDEEFKLAEAFIAKSDDCTTGGERAGKEVAGFIMAIRGAGEVGVTDGDEACDVAADYTRLKAQFVDFLGECIGAPALVTGRISYRAVWLYEQLAEVQPDAFTAITEGIIDRAVNRTGKHPVAMTQSVNGVWSAIDSVMGVCGEIYRRVIVLREVTDVECAVLLGSLRDPGGRRSLEFVTVLQPERASEQAEFTTGDLVQLKSGGPAMCVHNQWESGDVTVDFYDGAGSPVRRNFAAACLAPFVGDPS